MSLISLLKDYGLFNFGDLILLFVFFVSLIFFLFRSGLYLYFKWFGVVYDAKIVGFDKVAVLKNRSQYGVYQDTYQYTYEYQDQAGVKHQGVLKKLFLSGRYEVGDEVQIRYLKSNPKRVRSYDRKDWFRFEFMILIISLVLFAIVLIKAIV